MSWSDIIGQDRVKKILSRAYEQNKVSSAYLFYGIDGIGKEAIAFEFAKLLNCQATIKKSDFWEVSDDFDKRWKNNILNHNNIKYICAFPTGKPVDSKITDPNQALSEEQLKEIKTEFDKKSKDYYYKPKLTKANEIKIIQIRDIKNTLKMSNNSNGRRCFIISQVEKMNAEACNAFLKTLEEPAPNTCFILTTNNIDSVLDTIKSRCQKINFAPLPNQEIFNFFIQQGISEVEANVLVPFAEGSLSKAKSILDENLNELSESVINLLRFGLKKSKFRIDLINQIKELATNKSVAENSLLLLMILIRDVHRINSNYGRITNKKSLETLKKIATSFPEVNYFQVIKEIEHSLLQLKQNVNPSLVLLALMMKFRELFYQK